MIEQTGLYVVADGRCECCGRSKPMWTPEAIIRSAKKWPSTPSSAEWRKGGTKNPSSQTVREVFGTFGAMLKAAGMEARPRKNDARKGWDRASICDAIFRWHYAHGKLPRAHEWHTPPEGFPSTATVRRWFGGWNAAMTAAGYVPSHARRSRKGYSAVIAGATKRLAA